MTNLLFAEGTGFGVLYARLGTDGPRLGGTTDASQPTPVSTATWPRTASSTSFLREPTFSLVSKTGLRIETSPASRGRMKNRVEFADVPTSFASKVVDLPISTLSLVQLDS